MSAGENVSENEQSVDIGASFRVYEQLLDEINRSHPQHQGLRREEFQQAISSPLVSKTTVYEGGVRCMLPQLAPVSQFGWLNAPVYEKKFPTEAEKCKLLHLSLLPGVEPGDEVKSRLIELAANNGVIVFDYPANDTGYPDRATSLLAGLGVDHSPVDILATQTYFAGQAVFKRKKVSPEDPILDVFTAYENAKADGSYDLSRTRNGASIFKTIDPAQAAFMNGFYEDAYKKLNAREFCKQGIDSDEFMRMMTEDPSVVKVVNSVDGEIVALLLLENDLAQLSWANADYYSARYPEKYDRGQVMWFPGLAANPRRREGYNTQIMVDLLVQLVEAGNNEMLVVFDCGIINTGRLDVFLNRMINATPQAAIDIQPIAQQHYAAVKT